MKSTTTKMKNSLGFNSRFEQARERENLKICHLRSFTLRNRKKNKWKKSLRNLRDTIKHTNIHIMGVLGEMRQVEKIFEKKDQKFPSI